jgi:hypothetical protein
MFAKGANKGPARFPIAYRLLVVFGPHRVANLLRGLLKQAAKALDA